MKQKEAAKPALSDEFEENTWELWVSSLYLNITREHFPTWWFEFISMNSAHLQSAIV